MVDFKTPSYNNGQYEYPAWCHVIGWMVTALSLSALPILALVEILKTKPGGSIIQKFVHAWKSKIYHCPCCGAKLDESKRAHSDRSLTCLINDDSSDHAEENLIVSVNNNSEEKPHPV